MLDRVVVPDYVYWAGTDRHIMVAWDFNVDDWRAFAVDNIQAADLVGEEGR
jgi:predicted DNA-binding transcriptional regulator YafY